MASKIYCVVCRERFESIFHLQVHGEYQCERSSGFEIKDFRMDSLHDETLLRICRFTKWGSLKNLMKAFPRLLLIAGMKRCACLAKARYIADTLWRFTPILSRRREAMDGMMQNSYVHLGI